MDYRKSLTWVSELDWKIHVGLAAIIIFIVIWLYSSMAKPSCQPLINSRWSLTVFDKNYKGDIIINNIVAYQNYPDISRILGTSHTHSGDTQFNMALCFIRGKKIEIQDLPVPSGFGRAQSISSAAFKSSDVVIPVTFYHRSADGKIVENFKGQMERVN